MFHVGPRGHCVGFLLQLLQNYHTFSGLKQHKSLSSISEGQRFKMGFIGFKSRCQQGCAPSGGSRGKSVPSFFQFLETARVLGLWLLLASPKPAMAGGSSP